MANIKVDFSNYEKLQKAVLSKMNEWRVRATKSTLKQVVAHTLPNRGNMNRLSIKNVKTLQNRIKKDWLGKDGKRGGGITTAAFYTRSKVELKGFSPIPVAVQTKAGKQKKIYYKQPTITDANALIKAVNERTKSKSFNDTHFRRAEKDRKKNIFSYIRGLIFTTVGTIKRAAKLSAAKAGATVAGWTKAAQLLELQEFNRALPKNGNYTNLGEAKISNKNGLFMFTATNNAVASKETARKVDSFIQSVGKWYDNALEAEEKKLKKDLKKELKNIGGDIN